LFNTQLYKSKTKKRVKKIKVKLINCEKDQIKEKKEINLQKITIKIKKLKSKAKKKRKKKKKKIIILIGNKKQASIITTKSWQNIKIKNKEVYLTTKKKVRNKKRWNKRMRIRWRREKGIKNLYSFQKRFEKNINKFIQNGNRFLYNVLKLFKISIFKFCISWIFSLHVGFISFFNLEFHRWIKFDEIWKIDEEELVTETKASHCLLKKLTLMGRKVLLNLRLYNYRYYFIDYKSKDKLMKGLLIFWNLRRRFAVSYEIFSDWLLSLWRVGFIHNLSFQRTLKKVGVYWGDYTYITEIESFWDWLFLNIDADRSFVHLMEI